MSANVTRLRFPRHEHDHLCPIKHEEHISRENCTFCTLIDAARADEREQAAQRVAEFMDSDPVERETWDEFLSALIAAARGEAL